MSPRKMRLVADQIRGKNVEVALNLLRFNQKQEYALYMEKLLKSAIANWEQKNEGERVDNSVFIKSVMVDGGRMLKRISPAPQGRAYRVRKRSNHVTIIVDSKEAAINE